MGIGHAAVALGASRAVPRVNVGLLIFAAFLADFLLGVFGALGLEHAHVPPDFAARHYLTFTFPLLAWTRPSAGMGHCSWCSALLDGCAKPFARLSRNRRTCGFALRSRRPGACAGITAGGTELAEVRLGTLEPYATGAIDRNCHGDSGTSRLLESGNSTTKLGRWGIAIFMLLLTALTWTQLWSVTPPNQSQLVPTWIIAPVVFSAIPYVFDRKRVAAQAS